MAVKKTDEQKARPKPATLYKTQRRIIEAEGDNFNFSEFVRWCLSQDKLRSKFKEESNYT